MNFNFTIFLSILFTYVVVQLCKSWNIRTLNVVRNRENLDALVQELKEIGADEVFTEEEMKEQSKNRVCFALFHFNF